MSLALAALVIFYGFWVRIPVDIAIQSVARTNDRTLLSEYERRSDTWIGYDLRISSRDAGEIGWREIYLFGDLFDCAEPAYSYPASVLYAENAWRYLRASAKADRSATLHVFIPADVAARMKISCVRLEGGSYFMGRALSPTVRLPTQ